MRLFEDERCRVKGCSLLVWDKGLCWAHLRVKARRERKRGTQLFPENVEFLQELGISYRQWGHWHRQGWVTGSFQTVDTERLRFLAKASRLQSMPLNELADLLQEKEIV